MRWPLSAGNWLPRLRRLPCPDQVALTFDDGPTPETTPRLLRLLAEARAKATFFLTGIRAAAYRDLVAAIVAEGHQVFGHGWEHVNLEHDPQRAYEDMCRVEEELVRHRPTPDCYMLRLPYNAGHDRGSIHRAMRGFHRNVQFAWWSHCTYDYLIPNRCRDSSDMSRACREVAARFQRDPDLGGGIILLHEQPFDLESSLNSQVSPLLTTHLLRILQSRKLRGVTLEPPPMVQPLRRWVLLSIL